MIIYKSIVVILLYHVDIELERDKIILFYRISKGFVSSIGKKITITMLFDSSLQNSLQKSLDFSPHHMFL